MAEPDDINATQTLPPLLPTQTGRARRARWPVILVLVWATLAVTDVGIFHSSLRWQPSTDSQASASKSGASAPPHGARTTAPTAPAQPVASARVLVPMSASAFGLGGPGTGDNPQLASMAIDSSMTTAWTTDWYRTAQFGGLQAGTGLLIRMPQRVKITRVRIVLGSARGADLELLTGNVPALARMRLQATASDAGGMVRMKLARPKRARYLLVWFTSLPPDPSGTFQVSVYNVRIEGRR